jgi:hypothetical protein
MTYLVWTKKTDRYSYGSNGALGPYKVAEVIQPTQSKGSVGPRWRAEVLLPGIGVKQGLLFETEEEAQACADRVVDTWISKALPKDSPVIF